MRGIDGKRRPRTPVGNCYAGRGRGYSKPRSPLLRAVGFHLLGASIAVAISLHVDARAQGIVLIDDPAGNVSAFDLYQDGVIWWEPNGDCGDVANIGTVRVMANRFWGLPRNMAANCLVHPGDHATAVRDGTSVYYWYDGVLSRKGTISLEASAPLSLSSPPITVPQGSSPLFLHDGFLYWAEFFGSTYAVRSIPTTGVGPSSILLVATGGDVEKIEVVDYIDANFAQQRALLVLDDSGVLRRKRLTGDLSIAVIATNVRDFAVHTLQGLFLEPILPNVPAITSVYAAKGDRNPLPTSAPGTVEKINIATGAAQTVFTASGFNPVVAVATDSFQPRTAVTLQPRNLYLAEAVISCDPLCTATHHEILRGPMNVGTTGYDIIVVQGKAVNLRSDDDWLYWSSPDPIAVKLFRIATDAPAVHVDLQALGLEVVQNTQNLANQVALVAGKPTFVRAYGGFDQDIFFPLDLLSPSAELHVVRWPGNPIAGSPFRSKLNPNLPLFVSLDAARRDPTQSWLFELPVGEMLTGSYDLTLVLDPDHSSQETETTSNNSITATVGLLTKGKPCLIYKPVLVKDHGSFNTQGYSSAVDLIEQRATSLLPVQGFRHYFEHAPLKKIVFHEKVVPCFPFLCVVIVPSYEPFRFSKWFNPDDQKALDHLKVWSDLHNTPSGCGDEHYVGAVDPGAENFNGIGYNPGRNVVVRMEASPGTNPDGDSPEGGQTLAHELGHNYDRNHIDQTTSSMSCGDQAPADPEVPPFDTCTFSPTTWGGLATTHFGFDPIYRGVIAPDSAGDLMSYADNTWISDYTYDAIWSKVSSQGAEGVGASGPVTGNQMYLGGWVDQSTDEVTLITSLEMAPGHYSIDLAQRSHDEAGGAAGVYEWVLRDAAQSELARTPVTVSQHDEVPSGPLGFAQYIDWPGGVAHLELEKGGVSIFHRAPSANAPTIALGSPVIDPVDESLTLDWTASDADGDPLRFMVYYTPDGITRIPLELGYPALGIATSTRLLPGTGGGRIRVFASDGLRTTSDETPAFALPDHGPLVNIVGVREGEIVPFGRDVHLRGAANDAEDGPAPASSLVWSLSGSPVETGGLFRLEDPLPGPYDVELLATDSDGRQGSDSRAFEVAPIAFPETPEPRFDGACDDSVYRDGTRISIPLSDGEASVRIVHANGRLYACFIDLKFAASSAPATVLGIAIDTIGDQGAVDQAEDWGFFVNQYGEAFLRNGNAGAFPIVNPPPPGFDAYVDRGGPPGFGANGNWRAELRIADALLGGWNHAASLALVHNRTLSNLDYENWPVGSTLLSPNTWAAAYLGPAAPAPPNGLPVAEVTPDQIVAPLVPTSVFLDGAASHDPDGDPLTFQWTQTSGSGVTLFDPDSAKPHFSALPVQARADLAFELVVSDAAGSSAPVESRVSLFPVAQPPLPAPDPASAIPNFKTIGSPGNAADPETGWGAVAYVYEAGTHEVTNAEYVAFLNAVAGTDSHQLYDPQMTDDPRGGITRSGPNGAYLYGTKPYMDVMPVNFVGWLDAARYVNWLENGKPIGSQNSSTENGTYDLSIPSAGEVTVRQAGALHALGSLDEWYKAAYHEPVSGNYWSYPTGTSAPAPADATSDGSAANRGPGIANHNLAASWNGVSGNVIAATACGAPSPNGTLDQGGNVAEWTETPDFGAAGTSRIVRGGSFASDDVPLSSALNALTPYTLHSAEVGFRVFRIGSGDWDSDGISDASDNCPLTANPDQQFSADGSAGAACLCGDADDDGDLTAGDEAIIRYLLTAQVTAVPAPQKCQVSPGDDCDALTWAILARAAAGLAPGPQQVCPAAQP